MSARSWCPRFASALTAFIVVSGGCASSPSNLAAPPPVDVNGVWVGNYGEAGFVLRLQQTGATVVGYQKGPNAAASGDIEGTIIGNRLNYRGAGGRWGGELTVSGDEMSGYGTRSGNSGRFRREK